MTNPIIKVPDEDLAEADRLEAYANQTSDPDEAAGLILIASHLREPPNFPIMDDLRSGDECRQVIEELGAIAPYFPAEDSYRTLPVRLVHDQVGGFQIELGPYNLDRRELRVLHRAIVAWSRCLDSGRPLCGDTDDQARNREDSREQVTTPGAKESQSARLDELRTQVEAERTKALRAEPWVDVMTGIPVVDNDEELIGMRPMPTIDGKELFGTRLAFDLVGCAEEQHVSKVLGDYFKMIRDPEHMFLVCAAALDTIANYVVPALLDTLEHQASDYEARVRLVDAARNAWAVRASDLHEGVPPE